MSVEVVGSLPHAFHLSQPMCLQLISKAGPPLLLARYPIGCLQCLGIRIQLRPNGC